MSESLHRACIAGDLLREEVKKSTPEAQKLKDIMNSGGLVPDDTVIELVRKVCMRLHNTKILSHDRSPITTPIIDVVYMNPYLMRACSVQYM